jgi:hypothetical protein
VFLTRRGGEQERRRAGEGALNWYHGLVRKLLFVCLFP